MQSLDVPSNTNYVMQFLINGGGDTTYLLAKLWLLGNPEPGYPLSITDSSTPSNMQTAGRFGIYSNLDPTLRRLFLDNYDALVIPEPASIAVAGLGALLLVRHRLRTE